MSDSSVGSKVGELLDAYLRALRSGETPPRDELLAEHPDLATALDGLDFIHRATLEIPASGPGDVAPLERQLLGDYRLVREVGRGGMAVVYEAEQVSLGRRVALKVLPFAAVLDPKQLQRFKNEALAAAHLHHPHIVPVYAVGCERGVHYYAMQLVEGQSLAFVIREMRSSERGSGSKTPTPLTSHGSHLDPGYVRMAAAMAVQAAEALDHAHELGVVHRDVKPGNLLVDGLGELWVTDFGLARSARDGDLTMTGELLGTYRYMSPEQTHAKRLPLDHRTDIYSLGVTLYELLTLEPAFPGDDPHEVMRDIVDKEPIAPRRLNPALPVDFETIVLKAMSKDPSSRYATAQEMAEDLTRYLQDQPIKARRPSMAARAFRWTRRHRGLVAAAFVVLAITIVALIADKIRVGREQANTVAALGKANTNLLLARGAIEKFLIEIGVSNMSDQPVPKPARQRLLESALSFLAREFDDPSSIGTRMTILHALHRYDDALALADLLHVREPSKAWHHVQRGHMLWHLARHDEALAALDRAIVLEEAVAAAHSFRCMVLMDLRRPADARVEIERAIELDPKEASFRNYHGNVLAELGKPEEALAAYAKSIELDPNLPNPHSGSGGVLHDLRRLDEALAAYNRAIAVDANFAWGYTGRGMVLQSLGRLDEAIQAHDRAIVLDPTDAKAHVNRGIALRQLERLDAALAADQEAIRLDPKLLQARNNLAVTLMTMGRMDEAHQQMQEVLKLDPRDLHVRFNLGCYHTKLEQWDEAIAEYLEAIAIKPGFTKAYVNLASAYGEKGQRDLALEYSTKATELDADDPDAWGGLGNELRDRGEFDAALVAYGHVIRIRPTYAIAHYCRGDVLARRGKYPDAIECFRRAVELDEKFVIGHYALANALYNSRDHDQAIEVCTKALLLDPNHPHLYHLRGKAWGAKRELEREIDDQKKAVELKQDFFEAWTSLGRACNDLRRTDEAIEALTKALQIRPDEPATHLNLGIAWSGKNEPDRAIAEFEETVRLLARVDAPGFQPRSARDRHDMNILALAYNSLGVTYENLENVPAAIEAYRNALRLDKDNSAAHYNFGKLLYGAGQDAESEAHYREAIRLEADMPEPHVGLGRLFMAQGRYRESLPHLRKGRDLSASRDPSLSKKTAGWIAQAEARASIEERLDGVLAGTDAPRDERERTEFALILYLQKNYRTAAEFYEQALAKDATLADDLDSSHRYNAACTAVLAAVSGVPDPRAWRMRALSLLRTDLEARVSAGKTDKLDDWKTDPDFKTVREDAAALPEAERTEWTQLWKDVDACIARLR